MTPQMARLRRFINALSSDDDTALDLKIGWRRPLRAMRQHRRRGFSSQIRPQAQTVRRRPARAHRAGPVQGSGKSRVAVRRRPRPAGAARAAGGSGFRRCAFRRGQPGGQAAERRARSGPARRRSISKRPSQTTGSTPRGSGERRRGRRGRLAGVAREQDRRRVGLDPGAGQGGDRTGSAPASRASQALELLAARRALRPPPRRAGGGDRKAGASPAAQRGAAGPQPTAMTPVASLRARGRRAARSGSAAAVAAAVGYCAARERAAGPGPGVAQVVVGRVLDPGLAARRPASRAAPPGARQQRAAAGTRPAPPARPARAPIRAAPGTVEPAARIDRGLGQSSAVWPSSMTLAPASRAASASRRVAGGAGGGGQAGRGLVARPRPRARSSAPSASARSAPRRRSRRRCAGLQAVVDGQGEQRPARGPAQARPAAAGPGVAAAGQGHGQRGGGRGVIRRSKAAVEGRRRDRRIGI